MDSHTLLWTVVQSSHCTQSEEVKGKSAERISMLTVVLPIPHQRPPLGVVPFPHVSDNSAKGGRNGRLLSFKRKRGDHPHAHPCAPTHPPTLPSTHKARSILHSCDQIPYRFLSQRRLPQREREEREQTRLSAHVMCTNHAASDGGTPSHNSPPPPPLPLSPKVKTSLGEERWDIRRESEAVEIVLMGPHPSTPHMSRRAAV
jgi:hypothetical protein